MVSTALVLHGIAVVHMCVEHIPEVEPEPAMLVLASKDGWCGSQCMFTAESGKESRRKGRVTISMTMGREGISLSCSAWKTGSHFLMQKLEQYSGVCFSVCRKCSPALMVEK